MSADTGGSITQAAVYGKEENLCKFLKIKLKWQANNCSRFSYRGTWKMQICSRLLLHDFKTHVSCSGRGLTTSQKLAGWISAWLPQRNLHYQVSVRGINQTLQRSKSIYDGFINSLLTLDKERPICAKGLKVSRSNVAPRGTNTHAQTDTHTQL